MSDTYTYHPPRSDEAAWAAGIFEGEGSILISSPRPKNPTGRVMLQVGMTDEDIVRRLHEVFSCGHVQGPHTYKTPDGRDLKPRWRLQIAKQSDVVHTLALLLPYLGRRRKARALEALALVTSQLVLRAA